MTNPTPIEITSSFRHEVLAAASLDRQWAYCRIYGAGWEVTHVPTGRRYWVQGLDQGRTETSDGTAAKALEIGHAPRSGKPMVQGEYTAILGELTGRDLDAMVTHMRPRAAGVVAGVLTRVGLPVDYLDHYTVAPYIATKILGAVYGDAPGVWLDTLRAVRPDLIPPHLDRQPA